MATSDSSSGRVEQDCDACHKKDTDPRHHVYDPASGGALSLHFRCCAEKGCEVCQSALDSADANHDGDLLAHLTKDM